MRCEMPQNFYVFISAPRRPFLATKDVSASSERVDLECWNYPYAIVHSDVRCVGGRSYSTGSIVMLTFVCYCF